MNELILHSSVTHFCEVDCGRRKFRRQKFRRQKFRRRKFRRIDKINSVREKSLFELFNYLIIKIRNLNKFHFDTKTEFAFQTCTICKQSADIVSFFLSIIQNGALFVAQFNLWRRIFAFRKIGLFRR